MDQFIDAGKLPNFKRLRDESVVRVTDAEERAPNLEPWIQWVTVHTGLGFEEHHIFDLGDGHKLNASRIWDLVSRQGGRVLLGGSMNAFYEPGLKGYVIPDPWSVGVQPMPKEELDPFFSYVSRNVQEHSRDKMPVSLGDHVRFLTFMLSHGMSLKTMLHLVRQLMSERGGKNRWKRATILDRLQWDLFRHLWKRDQPQYATFFLNSTAHFQHMYWRNMDPNTFSVKPDAAEQEEFAGAVEYGYTQMDEIVGECLEMVGDSANLVLLTALSQQPCLVYEGSGGKTFYRPWEPEDLMAFAGIAKPWNYAPVMSEQFHLYFPTAEAATEAERRLQSLTLDGEPVMLARAEGKELFGGCSIFKKVDANAEVVCAATGERMRFLQLFYNVSGVKSGMHHPDGIFWTRQPGRKPEVISGRLPLREVFPELLSLVGVPAAESKQDRVATESLV